MEQNQLSDPDLKIGFFLFLIFIALTILAFIYAAYLNRKKDKDCDFFTDNYGTLDPYIKSINSSEPDCSGNLRDYFVKSAYNCCSGGNYKDGFVDICVLKNILKQGVRFLDFEIYSIGNQPVVASSVTDDYHYKESFNSIYFSDVIKTLQNYAFASGSVPNPDDPLLIHFRFKSANQSMYTNFATLLSDYTDILLDRQYSYESGNINPTAQPLLNFKGKIIIIVDRNNTSFAQNQEFLEYVNVTSNSAFLRAITYSDAKNTPNVDELIKYNKRNMTIVLPDSGSNPENPSTPYCQGLGCQFVAMRYQLNDSYLEQNNDLFDKCGYAFCLKPFRLRYHPQYLKEPEKQKEELSYAKRNVSTDYYSIDY